MKDVYLTIDHDSFAKYSAFVLLKDDFFYLPRYTMTEFVDWSRQWLLPDWDVSFDLPSANITFSKTDKKGNLLLEFSEPCQSFGTDNPVSLEYKKKSLTEKEQIAITTRELLDSLEVPDPGLWDFNENTADDFEKAFKLVVAANSNKKPEDLTWEVIKRSSKIILFINLARMIEVSHLNMVPNWFTAWALFWMSPEWILIYDYKIGGVNIAEIYDDCDEDDDGNQAPLSFQAKFTELTTQPVLAKYFSKFSTAQLDYLKSTTKELGSLINPPEASDLESESCENFRDFYTDIEILVPEIDPLVDSIAGIKLETSKFGTRYHEIQACKLLIAILLSSDIMQRRRKIANVPDKYCALAYWCSYSLIPHWQLEINPKDRKRGYGDAKVELYPLKINTGEKENNAFKGKFSRLLSSKSPILKQFQKLDADGKIATATQIAIEQYGNSKMMADGKNSIFGDGLIEIGYTNNVTEHQNTIIELSVRYNDSAIDKILDEISRWEIFRL